MSLRKFLIQRFTDAPHAGRTVSSMLVTDIDKALMEIIEVSKEFKMRPSLIEASTIKKFSINELMVSISRLLTEKSSVILVVSDIVMAQKIFDLIEIWKGSGFIDNKDNLGRLFIIANIGNENDLMIRRVSDYIYNQEQND